MTMKQQLKALCYIAIIFGFSAIIYDSFAHIYAEVLHRNGYIKQAQGYLKLANDDYKRATELIPWEKHYHLQLAKSYEDSAKKYPKQSEYFSNLAINLYKELMAFDNLNPWYQARLGLVYNDRYEITKNSALKKNALHYAKLTTKTDPNNPLFTLHYAHLLYKHDQLDSAIDYYKKTIEMDDELYEAHFNIAAIYLSRNDTEKMVAHYQKINRYLDTLQIDPNDTPQKKQRITKIIQQFQYTKIALANHYLSIKKPNKAYEVLNKATASIDKYELLAEFFIQTNNIPAAISVYKQLNAQLNTNTYSERISQLQQ